MKKNRSSTPCLGICSTTYGDDVCKGCKRFVHEVISWNKFNAAEKSAINKRLEQFKITILESRFAVIDADLFSDQLKEQGINFNESLEPLTWIYDLFRAAGTQSLDLNKFGIEAKKYFDPRTIKDQINNELLELSEAHFNRYFQKA